MPVGNWVDSIPTGLEVSYLFLLERKCLEFSLLLEWYKRGWGMDLVFSHVNFPTLGIPSLPDN